jgi:hypothetical protein
MKTGPKVKTWGENMVIQDIRTRLRLLRKDYMHRLPEPEFNRGYIRAMTTALDVIRKAMKSESTRRFKCPQCNIVSYDVEQPSEEKVAQTLKDKTKIQQKLAKQMGIGE